MGGLPCAKQLIDNRMQAKLSQLIFESQATTNNMLLKSSLGQEVETSTLEKIRSFELEMLAYLSTCLEQLRELNDAYAEEY